MFSKIAAVVFVSAIACGCVSIPCVGGTGMSAECSRAWMAGLSFFRPGDPPTMPYCSGYAVMGRDRSLLAVTAGHCTDGESIFLFFRTATGALCMGMKVFESADPDIAIVASTCNGPVVTAPLARHAPSAGSGIVLVSSPSREQDVITKGIVAKRHSFDARRSASLMLDVNAYSGSSGGAVYNTGGQVVGHLVFVATGTGLAWAVPVEVIRKKLEPYL